MLHVSYQRSLVKNNKILVCFSCWNYIMGKFFNFKVSLQKKKNMIFNDLKYN